jgi:hypothetical protein
VLTLPLSSLDIARPLTTLRRLDLPEPGAPKICESQVTKCDQQLVALVGAGCVAHGNLNLELSQRSNTSEPIAMQHSKPLCTYHEANHAHRTRLIDPGVKSALMLVSMCSGTTFLRMHGVNTRICQCWCQSVGRQKPCA